MEKMLEMLLHSAMKSAGLTEQKVKEFMARGMEIAQQWLDKQERIENAIGRIEHNTITIIHLVNNDLNLTPSFHEACAKIGGVDLDKKIFAPLEELWLDPDRHEKGAN